MAKRAYHHTMYRMSTPAIPRPVQRLTAVDEAEGFILEHALISPPRAWPPLPPEPDQQARVSGFKRKMDWEDEARKVPDEPVDVDMDAIVAAKGNAQSGHANGHDDSEKERCVICLMALRDRTIVGVCGHEFCVSSACGLSTLGGMKPGTRPVVVDGAGLVGEQDAAAADDREQLL